MSNYIRTLSVGDTVLCTDPKGKLNYMGDGVFNHKKKGKFRATSIVLLAGGSGITTLYHLMNAIYRSKETHINVKLIYSSKTRDDILCKPELDEIANDESCSNIQIYHTITREEGDLGPGYLKGRVTLEMLQ